MGPCPRLRSGYLPLLLVPPRHFPNDRYLPLLARLHSQRRSKMAWLRLSCRNKVNANQGANVPRSRNEATTLPYMHQRRWVPMHIYSLPCLILSEARLAQFPPKSAQSSLPTKDDISSVLNRQRAHRTLCRAVIKKASSGKKPQ